MKRVIHSMAGVAVAILLSPLVAEELDEPSGHTSDGAPITYKLSKHDYPRAGRATFWLDIKAERPHLTVTALCDLRKEKYGIGRFPLRQLKTTNEDRPLRFGVQCLSEDFVTDSLIRVVISDDATGKLIARIKVQLRDAIAADRSPDAT